MTHTTRESKSAAGAERHAHHRTDEEGEIGPRRVEFLELAPGALKGNFLLPRSPTIGAGQSGFRDGFPALVTNGHSHDDEISCE